MNAENTTVPTSVGADQHSHGGDRSGIFTQTVTIGTIAHVHKLSCSDAAVWAEFFKRGGRLDATAFSSFQTIDHRARWGGRAARVEALREALERGRFDAIVYKTIERLLIADGQQQTVTDRGRQIELRLRFADRRMT